MKTVARPAWLDAGTGMSLLSTQKWEAVPSLSPVCVPVITLLWRMEELGLFKKLENFQQF